MLKQNYFWPLSQYRLLPLSGAILLADIQKKKKKWGGRDAGDSDGNEGISPNRWINYCWDLCDNLVCSRQGQSNRLPSQILMLCQIAVLQTLYPESCYVFKKCIETQICGCIRRCIHLVKGQIKTRQNRHV